MTRNLLIAAIGTALFILGLALFLHSLGSGGGLFAVSLMLIGAVSTATAIVLAIVRVLKRNHEGPSG